MATSYANSGGTGDRTATITVTIINTGGTTSGSPTVLVNGNLTETVLWFTTLWGSSAAIRFQFASSKVIDEAKFYQSNALDHGTWQWQGSPDGSTWTNIGATFNLGTTTIQTQTTLSGNTTGYVFYQLVPAAPFGQFSSSPWVQEFEFKIDDAVLSTAIGRISQLPVEVAIQSDAPVTLQLSQLPVEVAILSPIDIRVTQDVIELLSQPIPFVRVTQYVVEVLGESTSSVIPSSEQVQFQIICP